MSPTSSLLIAVMAIWSFTPTEGRYYCPENCECSKRRMYMRNVFVVKSSQRNLTRVPDISGLIDEKDPVYIDLSNSNIREIGKSDFPPGLGITFVNLQRNDQIKIDQDAFKGLRSTLEYLNLESTDIPFNTTLKYLKGLTKLETLSLSYNNNVGYQRVAPNMETSLFAGLGLTSLKKIKMYSCGIKTMSERVFLGVESLQELDLGANALTEVPKALKGLPNLDMLDLGNSWFDTIKDNVFLKNTKLRTLRIENSKLTDLQDGAFHGLQNSLEKLVLSSSKIKQVPTSSLRILAALKEIKLDANPLTKIRAGAFAGKYCLTTLSLNQMDLSLSDGMFEGQENCLQQLSLQNVGLDHVPSVPLQTLKNNITLFLDNNQISELPQGSFSGMKLQLLVLDNNPLRVIEEGAFQGVSRPVYLSMTNTHIRDLSFVLQFPKGTFYGLNLQGTPVTCDCTLARVIGLVTEGDVKGTCSSDDMTFIIKSDDLSRRFNTMCSGLSVASSMGVYTWLLSVTSVLGTLLGYACTW